MKIKGPVGGVIAKLFYWYFEFIDRLFRVTLRIDGDSSGISFSLHDPKQAEAPIDERIRKIDSARENLLEGLKAIEELKTAAKENKEELEVALRKLEQIEGEKHSAEQELNQIKDIANSDIETFKKIAGIPGDSDKKRDRFLGFISGIVASLIASGLIFGGAKAIQYVLPLLP